MFFAQIKKQPPGAKKEVARLLGSWPSLFFNNFDTNFDPKMHSTPCSNPKSQSDTYRIDPPAAGSNLATV